MKLVLPLVLLIVTVLGCNAPTSSSRPSATEPSLYIEFSEPKWRSDANVWMVLNFEVRNTGTTPIKFLKTHASFYDKSDEFLISEQMYVDNYTELLPGQITPATVQTRFDRRLKNVRLTFTAKSPSGLDDVQVLANPVKKLK